MYTRHFSHLKESTLLDAEQGVWVRVIGFKGGEQFQRRLAQLGFLPGSEARVVRVAPFHGPLLIEADGREIVLGRGVAHRVLVEKVH